MPTGIFKEAFQRYNRIFLLARQACVEFTSEQIHLGPGADRNWLKLTDMIETSKFCAVFESFIGGNIREDIKFHMLLNLIKINHFKKRFSRVAHIDDRCQTDKIDGRRTKQN